MNITLWVVASLLSVVFLASGVTKLALTRDKLAASGMAAIEGFRPAAIKTIGILEILAALGLIVPAALDIAAMLVPSAAVGLILLMAGAATVHLRRNERQPVVVCATLLVLSALVAWGRFGPESFTG